MAKGDDSRSRNQVDYQTNLSQNNLNNLRQDTLIPQNQTMWNNYTTANDQAKQDYGNIMQGFQKPMAGYEQFAKTGGFSDQDLGNIRARATAPIRSMYAGANRDVDRQRALQGGYSPGYSVMKGRLAREGSSAFSDATTNAEGMIAQMVQQGKLAGLGGQADVGSRMSGLYGTTPGFANMAGNQALQSTNQRIAGEQLQGDISRTAIQGQLGASQLPGKFQSAMGNVQAGLGAISQAGGIIYPWLNPTTSSTGWQYPGRSAPL